MQKDKMVLKIEDINDAIESLNNRKQVDMEAYILAMACGALCFGGAVYCSTIDAKVIQNILLALTGVDVFTSFISLLDAKKSDILIKDYKKDRNELLIELKETNNHTKQLSEEKNELVSYNNTYSTELNSMDIKRERKR